MYLIFLILSFLITLISFTLNVSDVSSNIFIRSGGLVSIIGAFLGSYDLFFGADKFIMNATNIDGGSASEKGIIKARKAARKKYRNITTGLFLIGIGTIVSSFGDLLVKVFN